MSDTNAALTAKQIEQMIEDTLVILPLKDRPPLILHALEFVIAETGDKGADALRDYLSGVKVCQHMSRGHEGVSSA